MDIMKTLFGSNKKTSKTTQSLPDWMKGTASSNLGRAEDASKQGYEQYGGDRVAGFSGDQDTAFGMARNLAGQYGDGSNPLTQLMLGQFGGDDYNIPRLIDNITGEGGAVGSVSDYMDPYLQSVQQQGLGEMGRQADITRQSQIEPAAHQSGAFGDARHAILESEHGRNLMDKQNEYIASTNQAAYKDAMGMRNQDINRMLQKFGLDLNVAQTAGQESQRGAATGQSMIDMLLGTGGAQQGLDQTQANVDYGDFTEERDWDKEQTAWLAKILAGTPHGQFSKTTEKAPSSGIVGSVANIASMF